MTAGPIERPAGDCIRMIQKSRYHFACGLIRTAIHLLARFPRGQMGRLARPLGRIWYGLDRYHRKIAVDNLTIAFGRELAPANIRSLARKNFVQLVRVMLEIPSLLRISKENINDFVEFSGEEHLVAALSRGAGVIFLTAHLGNWELMALAASLKYNLCLHVMVRPLDYAPMDRVLTEIRRRTGNRLLDKDKSAAEVGALLRENRILGILLDQNASWYDGVFVPFFGKTACTNKGLAMFALRHDATVLPAFNIRQKDGRYRIIICPPVELVRSSRVGDDIVENTLRFNQIIEEHIRLAPDSWLWVHRRWRMKAIPEKARGKIRGITG